VIKNICDCQTPEELAEAIEYHLKQGGMRRDIINDVTGERKTVYDEHETKRLFGTALNSYNDIKKSYPKLPSIRIDTSDPLSGLAQIQQLCTVSENVRQEILFSKILDVLKKRGKSEEKDKDFEATKSALPPIAETYDILCRFGGECGGETTNVVEWLGAAANDGSGYCRAMLDKLASPKVVADLEKWQKKIAEKEQENNGTKKEMWYQNRTIQAALIGAGALLFVSIVGWLILLYIKSDTNRKFSPEAKTRGDNSPIVGGDYVEGDKIVNQKLSELDKEEIVTRIAERLEPKLSKQYSGTHTVFGVHQNQVVWPKGLIPENLVIDWDTGKFQSINNNTLMVKLPNMVLNGKLLVNSNVMFLEKRVGVKTKPIIRIGEFNPILEVIGIDDELVVVVLGFPVDDLKESKTEEETKTVEIKENSGEAIEIETVEASQKSLISVPEQQFYDRELDIVWFIPQDLPNMNWVDAGAYCSSLDVEGSKDWRLPSLSELLSLWMRKEELHLKNQVKGGFLWAREIRTEYNHKDARVVLLPSGKILWLDRGQTGGVIAVREPSVKEKENYKSP